MLKKRGQVWIETVIYTLIGLALIGVVLAIISPKITETRDRITVEQSIDSLSVLDEKIEEVINRGPGNVRIIPSFQIRRGELFINSSYDNIILAINDIKKPYSEPGEAIEIGSVLVISEEGQKYSPVNLMLNYSGVANITYAGVNQLKKFTSASVPYKFSITNLGDTDPLDGVDIFTISIEEESEG
jgi:type II secretory pathway pseudopilin PulG